MSVSLLKMEAVRTEVTVGGQKITLETGKMAKQADGAVLASCGNNMVLVTVVSSKKESKLDFFPSLLSFRKSSTPQVEFLADISSAKAALQNSRL